MNMTPNDRIFVAGGTGLVGSALIRGLAARGYQDIVATALEHVTLPGGRVSEPVDLRDQSATEAFFTTHRPDVVLLAAARVGGIQANSMFRADFILDNLQIQNNVISAAHRHRVKKLLFLGSSCIYPRDCPQPIKEDYLLTGPLEYTNEPYAIAKIAGIKLCESINLQHGTDFISVMPTNLYGPNDNFDLDRSHVLPAMIMKLHLAVLLRERDLEGCRRLLGARTPDDARSILARHGVKEDSVAMWGTGSPRREFLHVDDLADACLFLLENVGFGDLSVGRAPLRNTHVNIGAGRDVTIRELAGMVAAVVGFDGELVWDASKPDGTPRKLLDTERLKGFGWSPKIPLRLGIEMVHCEVAKRT